MSKIKKHYEEKAELALMGKFVPVESEGEVIFITNYILTVLDKVEEFSDFDIFADAIKRYDEDGSTNTVTHLGVNKVEGMPCITYCLRNPEVPEPFKEDYGSGYPASFCYVLNTTSLEYCSEFGDCFFEKKTDGYYHRVS